MKYVCLTIQGHYLRANGTAVFGSAVSSDGVGQGSDTIFRRTELGGGRISLRSLSGLAVVANGVFAGVVRGDPGPAGSFLEVWWPDDRISLQTPNGAFLAAEIGGASRVWATITEASDNAKFYYEVPAPELLPGEQQQPLEDDPHDRLENRAPLDLPPLRDRVVERQAPVDLPEPDDRIQERTHRLPF